MTAAHRSRFSRLAAGDAGLDPYTLQASDLYHDLFGQGSYIGKGIYDVAAFEAACGGRFPDNRLLSHDLIEGCYARSGLINDLELFEGVPSRLLADINRRHRWIRGDWQIASWLRTVAFPRCWEAKPIRSRPSRAGKSSTTCGGASRRRSWRAFCCWAGAGAGLGWHLHAAGPGPGLWPQQHCGLRPFAGRRTSPGAARHRQRAAVPAGLCGRGPGLVHSALHGALSYRCHRPYALSIADLPKEPAGMDDRQRCQSTMQREIVGPLPDHGGLPHRERRGGRRAAGSPAAGPLVCRAAARGVACRAAGRLVDLLAQSVEGGPRDGRRTSGNFAVGPADLELLRDLRGQGRQLAAARPCARRSGHYRRISH